MAESPPIQTNPENWTKNKLLIFVALTSLLGIITGAVESILKFLAIAESNFYLIVSLFWVALIIILLQLDFRAFKITTSNPKKIKVIAIIVSTVIFLFSIGWKYYELHIRKTGHAEHPDLLLGFIGLPVPSSINLVNLTQQPSPFIVEDMHVNEDLCSFTQSESVDFTTSQKIQSISFDQQLSAAFKNGSCFGVKGNEPAEQVLPVLRDRLDRIGKANLKLYIRTAADLSRMITERGDIFNQVMFTSAEIHSLKKSNPPQYELLKEWIINCIGIKQPVIVFTLLNKSNKDILINRVIYDVKEVGGIKGGESGPLYPVITYNHVLEHKKGLQTKQLNPTLLLKAKNRVVFNIRMISASSEIGLTWVMKMRFYDSSNRFATTSTFELIMSK
ncbi:MAG: hypothetical protein QM802_09265 [Agriterribacter sp.]